MESPLGTIIADENCIRITWAGGNRVSRTLRRNTPRYSQVVERQLGEPDSKSIKPMVSIDRNLLSAAANLLLRMGATQVFVFGSVTKDGLSPDSDIDMAVRGLPPTVYFSAISKASDLLGRPVDLVDLDDPSPLVRHLEASGELVRVA
jgi:predicted nucleotidyltransferase